MKQRLAVVALFAALTGPTGLVPALAQSVPEGQSCGGLLCDMGVFGHKTAASPAPPPGARVEVLPSATARQADASPAAPVAEPKRRTVHRKKRAAKLAAAPTGPVAKPVPPAPSVIIATPTPATPRPVAAQAAAAPAPSLETNVLSNPYGPPPASTFRIQPIY